MNVARIVVLLPLLVSCAEAPPLPPAPPPPVTVPPAPAVTVAPSVTAPDATASQPAKLDFKPVPLPGATPPASLDYIAFEPRRSRIWVPVGGAGSVDVYDTATGSFTRIDGFKTAQREHDGKMRTVGPSAVSIGDGVAYVGNRASSEVCSIDTATLKVGTCLKLGSPTDAVAYVSPTREVWITTPRAQSIVVLDATKPLAPKVKMTIRLDGKPEGYAVDAQRGLFLTNLEDKNKTVVIDVVKHTPTATWSLACDAEGPRGVATDVRGFIYVACTDHVLVLDGLHGGATIGTIDTGAGVDNIDWLPSRHFLYAAAAKAARLTIASIDDKGKATPVAAGASVDGARNGVADTSGNVYVADPVNARLLVFTAPP